MYQALYRKYRPQTFDDVAGQLSVTQTLRNQVITGKLSHAYLFTGSRGTGKTTCAKILAKAVNCENPVDGNPCNRCAACRGIDSGAVMDVQEIDAASNNGVDNVRSIRDEVVYPPAEVKKRVYIIDEVHMLSTQAFNALLKTIEEPPEHLMFILATTELNKVPATILSRCQRFAFRRPTAEDITGRIQYVAYQEGIDLEPDAAELLGRLADGAFRDGLSLLDQCASASTGTLTTDQVYRILGLAGQQQTVELMNAVADQDAGRALQLFSELYAAGKDAASLLGELSSLARDLLILKTAPKSGIGMISSICTGKEALALSPRFTTEELIRMVDILRETTAGFRTSVNQRVDGELCLIHLCLPALSLDAADLSARIARVEGELSDRLVLLEQQLQSGRFVPEEAPEAPSAPPEESAAPEPEPEPEEAEPPVPVSDDAWVAVVEKARPEVGPMVQPLLGKASGRFRGDDLLITPGNDFAHSMINKPEILETLRKKAAVVAGRPVRVILREPGEGAEKDNLRELRENFSGYDNIVFK